MNEEDNIIGRKRGIEELQTLLQNSRTTDDPSVRQVVIPIPTTNSVINEVDLNNLPGIVAISEFFLVAESGSISISESRTNDPSVEPQVGMLPGGGTISVQVNPNSTPVTASINISGHNISEYEPVTKLEFVIK